MLKNEQEIFDYVVKAIVEQGDFSYEKTPALRAEGDQSGWGAICKMRGPLGNKCAIGHLISDDEMAERMEGQDVDSLVFDRDLREGIDKIDVVAWEERDEAGVPVVGRLLESLMNAHDAQAEAVCSGKRELSTGIDAFIGRCRVIADEYGLKMPELYK